MFYQIAVGKIYGHGLSVRKLTFLFYGQRKVDSIDKLPQIKGFFEV